MRTVRDHGAQGLHTTTTALELAHGCLSCPLRLDLLPLLGELADRDCVGRVVLALDPAFEPEATCWALQHVVPEASDAPVGDRLRVDGVLAVLEAASWLDDVTGEDDLADRGLAATQDDDRTLAQLGLSQVVFADAVVLAGDLDDMWAGARLAAVLDRLVPGVPRARWGTPPAAVLASVPTGARRGRPTTAHDPLLAGEPPLHEEVDVSLVPFTADRPLHPGRLHDALDVLLEGVVSSWGRIWLASQPERVIWLESAGQGLRVADTGPWLADLPPDEWDDVPPERQVAAALRWDPERGDRCTELVVLTHGRPAESIRAALAAAVLTDAEHAAGPAAWRLLPDPFGQWHEDPCETTGVPDPAAAGTTDHRTTDHHEE